MLRNCVKNSFCQWVFACLLSGVKVLVSHFLWCFILLGSVGLRDTILSVLICLEFASLW